MAKTVNALNRRLAGYRKLAGYTQSEVAEILGIKCNTFSRIERHGNPNAQILKKLSEIYKIPMEKFFYDEPDFTTQTETEEAPKVMEEYKILPTTDGLNLSAREKSAIKIVRNLPKKQREEIFAKIEEFYKKEYK